MTVLETERLILKPVAAAHEEALHRLHRDALIVRALWDGRLPTRQHTRERLALYLTDWRQLGIGFWMVYERRDDGPVLVGRSGLRCLDGSSVVEFGHCFSTAGSGRGLAVEAGKRVFEHAFRSEEHTSELQSLMRISYALFCLQKKKPKAAIS